ncbi:P-loop containing nucleoside triphosphate hydrolase protein [Pavlovales sp. CCMP2436]|nr:P-loop containing nucleoside triphosphate hydrolase protein [Pavlovales sp. CCMP2436]
MAGLPAQGGVPLAREPHFADREALAEWQYPSDAQFRRYQFDAVLAALRENVLVSFPTGLGKTLVGAVVMHNFLRWFPRSLVIFIAPTRPLVAQQLDAVVTSVPIARGDACLLTGAMQAPERVSCYACKRALFMTAQTLQNDLFSGICPASRISLLVLDEAHHATGEHAYSVIARRLAALSCNFRTLALSATAGKDVAAVQRVIHALHISSLVASDETDPLVSRHCHEREVHTVIVSKNLNKQPRGSAGGKGGAAAAQRASVPAEAAIALADATLPGFGAWTRTLPSSGALARTLPDSVLSCRLPTAFS